MSRNPNNAGASQFHKSITTPPPIAVKIKIPRIASGASKIIFVSLVIFVSLSFMLCSSLVQILRKSQSRLSCGA